MFYLTCLFMYVKVVLLSSPQDCCSFSTFLNQPWRTPAARVSALYHLYEDTRGVISYNLQQIAPGYPAVDFTVPFNPMSSSSQIVFSTISPQTSCPCTTRAMHCSTALDSCAPLTNTTARSGSYLYHRLWQFLAFGV